MYCLYRRHTQSLNYQHSEVSSQALLMHHIMSNHNYHPQTPDNCIA